jgi:hypothetical protein
VKQRYEASAGLNIFLHKARTRGSPVGTSTYPALILAARDIAMISSFDPEGEREDKFENVSIGGRKNDVGSHSLHQHEVQVLYGKATG